MNNDRMQRPTFIYWAQAIIISLIGVPLLFPIYWVMFLSLREVSSAGLFWVFVYSYGAALPIVAIGVFFIFLVTALKFNQASQYKTINWVGVGAIWGALAGYLGRVLELNSELGWGDIVLFDELTPIYILHGVFGGVVISILFRKILFGTKHQLKS